MLPEDAQAFCFSGGMTSDGDEWFSSPSESVGCTEPLKGIAMHLTQQPPIFEMIDAWTVVQMFPSELCWGFGDVTLADTLDYYIHSKRFLFWWWLYRSTPSTSNNVIQAQVISSVHLNDTFRLTKRYQINQWVQKPYLRLHIVLIIKPHETEQVTINHMSTRLMSIDSQFITTWMEFIPITQNLSPR